MNYHNLESFKIIICIDKFTKYAHIIKSEPASSINKRGNARKCIESVNSLYMLDKFTKYVHITNSEPS